MGGCMVLWVGWWIGLSFDILIFDCLLEAPQPITGLFFSNRDLRNFQKESGISVLEKSKKNEQHGLGYNHFYTATNKKVFCTVRVRFTAQYSQKNGLKYIWKCISKVRDKLEKYWKSQGKVSEFCIEGKSGIPLLGIVWYHEQFLNKFFYALGILLVGLFVKEAV